MLSREAVTATRCRAKYRCAHVHLVERARGNVTEHKAEDWFQLPVEGRNVMGSRLFGSQSFWDLLQAPHQIAESPPARHFTLSVLSWAFKKGDWIWSIISYPFLTFYDLVVLHEILRGILALLHLPHARLCCWILVFPLIPHQIICFRGQMEATRHFETTSEGKSRLPPSLLMTDWAKLPHKDIRGNLRVNCTFLLLSSSTEKGWRGLMTGGRKRRRRAEKNQAL